MSLPNAAMHSLSEYAGIVIIVQLFHITSHGQLSDDGSMLFLKWGTGMIRAHLLGWSSPPPVHWNVSCRLKVTSGCGQPNLSQKIEIYFLLGGVACMKFEVIFWNLLHSLQMIKGQVCRRGSVHRSESTLLTVVFSRPTLCYLSFFHNCDGKILSFGLLWARYGGTKLKFGTCLVLVTLSKKEHACTCLFHFISFELLEILHHHMLWKLLYFICSASSASVQFHFHLTLWLQKEYLLMLTSSVTIFKPDAQLLTTAGS